MHSRLSHFILHFPRTSEIDMLYGVLSASIRIGIGVRWNGHEGHVSLLPQIFKAIVKSYF